MRHVAATWMLFEKTMPANDVSLYLGHSSVEFTMNVPGEAAPDSTVRFDIAPDGKGGSRFTLTQSGITDQMVEMGKHGWVSTLGRLEKLMGVASKAA